MSIGVKTSGLHHVSLRTRDLPRSRRFYHEVLGFAVIFETDELCMVKAGGAMIGLRAPASETAAGDAFDPFRVGMDHVALGCESREELDRHQRRSGLGDEFLRQMQRLIELALENPELGTPKGSGPHP